MHFTEYFRPANESIDREQYIAKLQPITDWNTLSPGDLIFSNRAQSITYADTFVELKEKDGITYARYRSLQGIYSTPISSENKEWYLWDEELAIILLKTSVDKVGRNLFTTACLNGDQLLIKKLLNLGMDVNHPTKEKQTAICYTVQNHDMELTKLLVLHGADLHVVDDYEQNLLHYAAHNKENIADKISMFRYLIEAGISLHKKDTDGNTPLITLVMYSNRDRQCAPKISKFLIENGANVNERDSYNVTALTNAMIMNHIKLAQVLLENGADINGANSDKNKSIVEYARTQEAIDLFEKYKHQLTPENHDIFLQKRLEILLKN